MASNDKHKASMKAYSERVQERKRKELEQHLIDNKLKIDNIYYCYYGCGQIATHQLKNGKWVCNKVHQRCPELIRISKEKLTGQKRTEETKRKLRKIKRKPEVRKMYSERMTGDNNPMKDPETAKKVSEKLRGENNPNYGKKKPEHSILMTGDNNPSKRKDVRRKLRLKTIEKIESNLENGYQVFPFYNSTACILIDEYGKQYGYNFQHAMNGGEFYIKELGYWVDGYDEDKNIIVEVDEPFHYNTEGNLLERDIRRQQEIMDFLKCEFIRIKIDNDNNVIGIARLKNKDVI